jgi:hypothetical protein
MDINIDLVTKETPANTACYAIAGLSILSNLSCAISLSMLNKYIQENSMKSMEFRANTIIHWITCIYILSIMVVNIVLLAKKDLSITIMIFNMICCLACFISFITVSNLAIKINQSSNEDNKSSLIHSIIIITLTIGILSTFCVNLLVVNSYATMNGKRDIINWISFGIVFIYIFFIIGYAKYDEINKNSALINIHIISCISIIPIILSFHLNEPTFNPLPPENSTTTVLPIASSSSIDVLYVNGKSMSNYTNVSTNSYEITELANEVYINSKEYDINNQLIYTINNKVITIGNFENIAFIHDENNNLRSLAIIVDSNKIITNEQLNIDTTNNTYVINMQKAACVFNNMSINDKMNEFHLGHELRFKVMNNAVIDTKSNKTVGEVKDNMIFIDSKPLNTLTLGTKIISIDGIFINEEISNFTNNRINFYYTKNDKKLILNNSGIYE